MPHTCLAGVARYHLDACAGSAQTPHDYITNVRKILVNRSYKGIDECSTGEATREHCLCVHAVLGGPKTRGPKNHHGTQRIHRRQHVVTQNVCFRCGCCNPCAHVCSLHVFVTQLCLLACFTRWSPDSQRTGRYLFPDVACCRNEPDFWVQVRVAVPGARSMRARLLSPVCSFGSTLSSWQWRLSCLARSTRCHVAGRPVFGPKKMHRFRDHQNSSTGHVCPRCYARKHGRYPSLTDIVFVRRHAKKGTALHDGVGSLMFFFFSSDSRPSKDAN